MNRTLTVVASAAVVVIAAAYFYMSSGIEEAGNGGSAPQPVATMTETEKAAVDFCVAKGGKIETVIAAEGKVNLCVFTDGSKIEAGQLMRDNKTE